MAQMTQEQLDELLAERGGSRLKHSPTARTRKVKNPSAIANGGNDENAPAETEQEVQSWEDPETGAKVEAVQQPDGTWTVVTNKAGTKKPKETDKKSPPGGKPYIDEEGPNGRRLGWNPETGQYDRDIGSSPSAQAAAQGATKREPVQINGRNLVKVTTAKGGQTETYYEDEQGNRVQPPTEKPDAPKPVQVGGKWGYWKPGQNGGEPIWTPLPGPNDQKKPEKGADGSYGYWDYDAAGTPVWKPVQGPAEDKDSFEATPSGLTPFTPDYDDEHYGLVSYRDQLDAWVQAQGRTPEARKTATRLLKQAGDVVALGAKQSETLDRRASGRRDQAITQRGHDLDEIQSRRSNATTQFDTVNDTYAPYAAKLIPSATSGETAVDGFRSALRMGQRQVEAAGGMERVPRVDVPQATPSRPMPNIRMSPDGTIEVNPAAPAPAPAPVAAAAPAAPGANTIGVGGVGLSPAPSAPGANDVVPGAPTGENIPVNPPMGEIGNSPDKPVGKLFNPDDHLGTLLDMGYDEAEARNIIALKKRGVTSDQV